MGRLTEDMTRLAGEIMAGRRDRGRMVCDLRRASADTRARVGTMMKGFRSAHAEMRGRQRRNLHAFRSGLQTRVRTIRDDIAKDMGGARSAWAGLRATASRREVAHPEPPSFMAGVKKRKGAD